MIKKAIITFVILLTLSSGVFKVSVDNLIAEDDLFEWNRFDIVYKV